MTKRAIKSVARRLGYEIRRYAVQTSDAARLTAMLEHHRVSLVFDVGANTGQFAQELRDAGYRGKIVSFEPLAEAHRLLTRNAAADALWQVAPRAALGAEMGEIEMNVAANSESSSILPMLDAHGDAAPEAHYVGVERVTMQTFDTAAAPYLHPDSVAFLKIDTQGYEEQVLAGAASLLPRIAGLRLELSLVPLYAGARLMPDVVHALREQGFDLWGIAPAFVDPHSGRTLQVDGTFFRRSAHAA